MDFGRGFVADWGLKKERERKEERERERESVLVNLRVIKKSAFR